MLGSKKPRQSRTKAAGVSLICYLVLSAPSGSNACSAFAVTDADGNRIVAYELDWYQNYGSVLINPRGLKKTSLADPNQIGRSKPVAWSAKFASLTFNELGRGFPFSGMNEAGLIISGLRNTNGAMIPDSDPREYLNSFQFIQYALDTSETFQDVVNAVNSLNGTSIRLAHILNNVKNPNARRAATHYFICDTKSDTCGVIEFGPTSESVRLLTYDTKMKNWTPLITNYLTGSSLGESGFPPANPEDNRYRDGLKLLAQYVPGQINPIVATNQIQDKLPYPDPKHAHAYWHVVYDSKNRRAYFNTDNLKIDASAKVVPSNLYSQNKYIDFDKLDNRLFSCRGHKRRALNMAIEQAGDYTSALQNTAYNEKENETQVNRSYMWDLVTSTSPDEIKKRVIAIGADEDKTENCVTDFR